MAKSYFGENLRRIRKERDMTQKELASLIMTHWTCVSEWELGKTYPQVIWIYEIANKLNISPEELIREMP